MRVTRATLALQQAPSLSSGPAFGWLSGFERLSTFTAIAII